MAALFEVYTHTFGDEERRRMLDVTFTLRRFKIGVEAGPIDYTSNEDDWHVELCFGPLSLTFYRLGKPWWSQLREGREGLNDGQ